MRGRSAGVRGKEGDMERVVLRRDQLLYDGDLL